MVFLRVHSGRILFVILLLLISLLSVYYMLLRLPLDEEDDANSCSWCRTMGHESVGKQLNLEDVDVYNVLGVLDTPMYLQGVDMIENGIIVMHHEQFVLRGLTKLSSIRKSVDNIFLVESSCTVRSSVDSGEFVLDARQACGAESTARANPDRPVYLLHSCPLPEDFALRVSTHARALLELHNVYVVVPDLAELSKGWPDPLPDSSTSLGLLALWQYGGTYCHLDTLTLRSLRPLGTNYCGYRDDDLLLSDLVLNFEPLGYGHTVVTRLLSQLSKSVHDGVWREDDTYLTKVVIDECSLVPETTRDCSQLTIYDSTVLYNVGLTDEVHDEEFVDRVKITAYIINYFTRLYSSAHEESTQAFYTLAKEFCPVVYTRCNHTF